MISSALHCSLSYCPQATMSEKVNDLLHNKLYLWITTPGPVEGAAELSVTIRDKIKHYEAK